MVVGVLGAIAQDDVKRILSFHIVSQIGYMVMGLGLFTVAGLAGAVYAIVHHIVVKTTLFLAGGLIEHAGGSAACTASAAWSTTAPADRRAVPPAGAQPGRDPAVLRLRRQVRALRRHRPPVRVGRRSPSASLVSLLTLFSMLKIWVGVFWSPAQPRTGADEAPTPRALGRPRADGAPDGRAGRAHPRDRPGRRTALRPQRPGRRRPARPVGLPRRRCWP